MRGDNHPGEPRASRRINMPKRLGRKILARATGSQTA